jgi:hypothetical protein
LNGGQTDVAGPRSVPDNATGRIAGVSPSVERVIAESVAVAAFEVVFDVDDFRRRGQSTVAEGMLGLAVVVVR